MARHREPSLRGRTKAAKARRKALFRRVYAFLEAGETVQASDEENYNGRWRRVREKYVGKPAATRGQFRRRTQGFVPLDDNPTQ